VSETVSSEVLRHAQAGRSAESDRVALLRLAAQGRRAYADECAEGDPVAPDTRSALLLQAATLEQAAQIMEGEDAFLFSLLPERMWTDGMRRSLDVPNQHG
jgi:hypothetical protein